MFKLIQRYLTANFIAPFVLSTFFFVAFLLTFQLFRIIKIVISKGVEWTVVMELVGHIAISFIPMAVPLSCLFATIYTLNKLSDDSEIVAMRSFGVTKFKLFLPFLISGLFIGACIFSLNNKVIPASKTQFKNTIIRLTSTGVLTDIKSGQFFTEVPGVTLFADEVEEKGKMMKHVFIQKSKKGNLAEQVVHAKEGSLIKILDEKWGVPSVRLHLKDGVIIKRFEGQDGEIEKILFKDYDFPLTSGGAITEFVTKDGMKTNSELKNSIRDSATKSKELKLTKRQTMQASAKTQLEYWSRINTPIQCVLFIFLGFVFGIKHGRGKTKNTSGRALSFLLSYYAVFFFGVSLSRKGILDPMITTFSPTVVSIGLGIYLYRKLDWAS
ncbi:LptF/LptG family permease [Halobacteriovorax sp. HLS]|uniref:LptF/LptG family permease n=1 Tax=Halobacteriovorax sp. HLS TaxID=2234000 RepID=UPI000FD8D576|nr:LptF/LptG family permease [Halobacteriovorax sp. HLS]